jgi:hypothetical protein
MADRGGHTLAPKKAVTPLQTRKIKRLTRNISRYKPSYGAVTIRRQLCFPEIRQKRTTKKNFVRFVIFCSIEFEFKVLAHITGR